MRPIRTLISGLAAVALIAAVLSAPIAAAAVKPAKLWNVYQDKTGVYTCTSSDPRGQTKIAGPFTTQAACMVVLRTPPTIDYTLTPATPTGLNGWYKGDVSLAWNIAYPIPNKVSITGAANQVITVDQLATDYSGSVTAIGGSAGPVTVSIKRDATGPVITWDSLIKDGDTFLVGSVPAEPTVSATDATSGTEGATLTGYGTAVGSHTLVATATDAAGNVTREERTYTVTLKPANVIAPTATDQTWNGTDYVSGGIDIPAVTGVDYSIDGTVVTSGFKDRAPGTYAVTAKAQPDYELTGYPVGGWDLTIAPAIIPVTPIAPTATHQTWNGTAFVSGAISIPAVVGVNYFIDNAPAAAGPNNMDPGNYSVSAEAQAGYALQTYDGPWSLTINAAVIPDIEVTPVKPTVKNESATGTLDGGITIPAVTGVDYFIDDALASSGFNALAVRSYVVTVQAQQGFALENDTSPWTLVVAKDAPPKFVEFVGATVGTQASTTIALPSGWQAGDLAVMVVMKNACGAGSPPVTCPPTIPSGWTGMQSATYSSTATNAVSSRLVYRVLLAGDTGTVSTGSYRAAAVMVYRNAAVGAVGVQGSGTSTTLTVPGLTLQQTNGSSWVGSFVTNFNGLKNATAPAGMVSRTAAALGSTTGPGGFDTNGGVTAWSSTTMTVGAPWNAYSFELKLVP